MNEQEFQDLIYDMYYPDEARQDAAKRRYAELDREERVSHLGKVLQTDMDGLIWRAVVLLLQDDPTRHLPSILPLFDSGLPGVRYVVSAIFGDGGLSVALPQLTRLAETDPDGRVRYAAIAALGRCGSVETIDVLVRLLDSDDDDGEGRKLSEVAKDAIAELKGRLGIE
jgi:HEAT repeat protein